ncbi:glycosyltransferase [Enterococcus wangshanyuanii]|uniref:Hyaluronan synthase n=1 Tax=Enterococcus wangshanyuanii TaxID=2005703 RepID=A0ABQ1NLL0_9ENTE|nr:glycosyltransferase [Enterococcus wangshanyuanii]GGC80013.1 hyaluronan synthase [Enterococcus wangshanyuanii]
MKRSIFFLLEVMGKVLLFLIPIFSIVYIVFYELTHFKNQTIEQFVLSGKLPITAFFLVVLFVLIIHFTFNHSKKALLKHSGITPKIRRYKMGYWASKRKNSNEQTLFKKSNTMLFITIVATIILGAIWFGYRLRGDSRHSLSGIAPFFTMSGGMALATLVLSTLYTPYTSDGIRKRNVHILMPIYNEPVENIENAFRSILNQTVKPVSFVAVDDGSQLVDYTELSTKYQQIFAEKGIRFQFLAQENSGKRAAQLLAYRSLNITDYHNELILTVDSDTVFEKHAIEQGIIPFDDEQVYSVAGVIVTRNITDNILTIITDLLVVGHMVLIERSMNSMFGSVAVNSGPIAFYRAEVLKLAETLGYENEQFGRARVEFSDDSFLTMAALLLGRTVAQSTAVSYTELPNKISHHVRQHLRWSRGSFIRGFWRLSLFPINSFVFFRQAFGWAMFASMLVIKLQLFYWLIFVMTDIPILLLAPLAFSAVYSLSYISIPRNDLAKRDKWIVFCAFPFTVLWMVFVLSPVRVWGYITHKNTGWGTRNKIEL